MPFGPARCPTGTCHSPRRSPPASFLGPAARGLFGYGRGEQVSRTVFVLDQRGPERGRRLSARSARRTTRRSAADRQIFFGEAWQIARPCGLARSPCRSRRRRASKLRLLADAARGPWSARRVYAPRALPAQQRIATAEARTGLAATAKHASNSACARSNCAHAHARSIPPESQSTTFPPLVECAPHGNVQDISVRQCLQIASPYGMGKVIGRGSHELQGRVFCRFPTSRARRGTHAPITCRTVSEHIADVLIARREAASRWRSWRQVKAEIPDYNSPARTRRWEHISAHIDLLAAMVRGRRVEGEEFEFIGPHATPTSAPTACRCRALPCTRFA